MTLPDLCEPLFLFVCKVNRSKRKGGPSFEPAQLRAEIERILREMALAAYVDRDLTQQFNLVKPALLAFVDEIAGQALPGRWQNMTHPEPGGATAGGATAGGATAGGAATSGGAAGNDEFFQQLEKTLADNSRPALHRLTIFYTCLGLGYTGSHKDDPRGLTDKINQVAGRIQEFMDLDEKKRLCSSAYECTDQRNLEPPVARSLAGVAIVLAGLIVIVFAANTMLYHERTDGLQKMVDRVIRLDQPITSGVK